MTGPSDAIRVEASPGESGLPLDRLLLRRLPDMTRAKVRVLLEQGRLRLNGAAPSGPAVSLSPGDVVEIAPVEHDAPSLLYEDSGFLVLYKPAGVPLLEALRRAGGHSARFHRSQPPRPVSPLEDAASGVAVAAFHPRDQRRLEAAFAGAGGFRRYLALVAPPPVSAGARDDASGWAWQVVRRFRSAALVRLTAPPGPGQRPLAALAALGWTPLRLPGTGPRRLAVHAAAVGFPHPRTGRRLHFEPPPPPAFLELEAAQEAPTTLSAGLPAEPPHGPVPVGQKEPAAPEPALRSPRARMQRRRSGDD